MKRYILTAAIAFTLGGLASAGAQDWAPLDNRTARSAAVARELEIQAAEIQAAPRPAGGEIVDPFGADGPTPAALPATRAKGPPPTLEDRVRTLERITARLLRDCRAVTP
jgi:hypothetical protein